MVRYGIFLLLALISGLTHAHQFLPTYPIFEPSFVDGVFHTKMELFNKRKDVEYYELAVYDSDWNPMPFATENILVQIRYLETKKLNVYIRKEDLKRVTYICSESKLKKQDTQYTVLSSKICSKVK